MRLLGEPAPAARGCSLIEGRRRLLVEVPLLYDAQSCSIEGGSKLSMRK